MNINHKIEFRQKYTLDDDSEIKIRFLKGNPTEVIRTSKGFIIENLSDSYYKNSIMNEKSIIEGLQLLKTSQVEIKEFPTTINISASTFNNSERILKFDYEIGDRSKFIDFKIKTGIDSNLMVEIQVKSKNGVIKLKGE